MKTLTVAFGRSSRPRATPPTDRVPRVARQLSLAHEIERRIRVRELEDLAHAARVFGLTRARVTQLVSLTLLAPTIQEEILALPPVTVGRDPITERTLRPIVAEPVWERQVALWHGAFARTSPPDDSTRDADGLTQVRNVVELPQHEVRHIGS